MLLNRLRQLTRRSGTHIYRAMSKSVRTSAPGKVILFGEHAVVYGKHAVAACIDLRTTAHIRQKSSDGLLLEMRLNGQPEVSAELSTDVIDRHVDLASSFNELEDDGELLVSLRRDDDGELSAAERSIHRMLARIFAGIVVSAAAHDDRGTTVVAHPDPTGVPNTRIIARVTSELPTAAGLGSSASFCVALSAAALSFFGAIADDDSRWSDADRATINKLAFEGEKMVHGNPSGIDNTIVTFGGAFRFSHASSPVSFAMPATCRVLIVDTRVLKRTKLQVQHVARMLQERRHDVETLLSRIGQISCDAEAILSAGGVDGIAELLGENHDCLRKLGVSHPSIEKVIEIAARHGLSAKLTGSGGGGCVLVFLPDDCDEERIDKLVEEMQLSCFDCYRAALGGRGVATHFS